ncbi:MAG: hypothetical protein U0531_07995 [Dehalococcoidia bacterium]
MVTVAIRDDQRRDVGQNVPQQDAPFTRPECARRLDVDVLLDSERRTANHPRGGRGGRTATARITFVTLGPSTATSAMASRMAGNDEHVHDPLQNHIDRALTEAGHQPDRSAGRGAGGDGDDAHPEGDTSSRCPAEDIAGGVIGAELKQALGGLSR